MKLAKEFNKKIYFLTDSEFNKLYEKYENEEEFTKDEKGLFIYEEHLAYVAVDNRTGQMWGEEFKLLNDAYIYLLDLKEAEPLHQAEATAEWW